MTNRVAGFICKHVFTEHSSCVTGLAVVGREAGYNTTYLVRFTCNVKYVTMLKLRRARLLISTLFSRMKQLEVLLLPLLIHHRLTPPPPPPDHSILSFVNQTRYLSFPRAGRGESLGTTFPTVRISSGLHCHSYSGVRDRFLNN